MLIDICYFTYCIQIRTNATFLDVQKIRVDLKESKFHLEQLRWDSTTGIALFEPQWGLNNFHNWLIFTDLPPICIVTDQVRGPMLPDADKQKKLPRPMIDERIYGGQFSRKVSRVTVFFLGSFSIDFSLRRVTSDNWYYWDWKVDTHWWYHGYCAVRNDFNVHPVLMGRFETAKRGPEMIGKWTTL